MPEQILPAYPLADRYPWPCLRLARAFRIAADVRKLFLGGVALLLLAGGQLVFSYLPFAPQRPALTAAGMTQSWGLTFDGPGPTWLEAPPLSFLVRALHPTPEWLVRQAVRWDAFLWPLRSVYEPAAALVQPGVTWTTATWSLTQLLWALAVWSLFGGALTRMAAVQFSRDEKLSVSAAFRFSAVKFFSYFTSPLLPLTGVAALGALCGLGGLLGRIPDVGPVIVACAWFLALALALLMTLMLLGAAAGWPLMVAAISTEASDAFDGFSRSYSFVFSRPWHYAGYALFALVYGSVVLVFLSVVAALIARLAAWGVALGMGRQEVARLYLAAPRLLGGTELAGATQGAPDLAAYITGGWLFVLAMLLAGFLVSFFWTASTIIYFLLRHVDDATGFDEVWLPEPGDVDDLLPLAGVAASPQPVIERPIRPPADGAGTESASSV